MKFFSAMCIMYIVGKQLYWKTSHRQGKHLVNLLSVIDFGTFPSNNMTVLMVRINIWINIYIFLRCCRFLCRPQFEQNFLCDSAYYIYANHQPSMFCQSISNHFELENDVKMTLKCCAFFNIRVIFYLFLYTVLLKSKLPVASRFFITFNSYSLINFSHVKFSKWL